MVDLSLIIVNYNVKEFLQKLLDSIKEASNNLNTEVIVVDNASTDGSVEVLRERYSWVKLIDSKVNLGFGAANNLGLEISTGKYILLINPDTIVKEDTLDKMVEFFKNTPDAGMAGCKVLNPDGSLQLPCRRGFPGPWTSFTKITGLSTLFPKSKLFARYNLTFLDENETYEVDAISGAFMFFNREVYETIGGFDPEFFMYGEDLDLCYRTQKAGFKVYYYHDTQIIHYQGESTKRSNMNSTRVFYDAMHKFVKKHFSSYLLVEVILQMAIFLRKLLAFVSIYRFIIFPAIIDFVFVTVAIIEAETYLLQTGAGFPDYAKPWVYLVPAIIQLTFFAVSGVYRKNSFSVLKNILTLFAGFVFISAFTYFFKQYAFSRAVVLITFAILLVALPLWRIIAKLVFRIGVEDGLKKTRTIVIGSSKEASNLAEKLQSNYLNIHNVIGLVGFGVEEIGKEIDGFEVIGSTENILRVVESNKIDKVIFASDQISFDQMFSVVSKCQGYNIEFLVAGNEHDFIVGKTAINMLDDIPLVHLSYNISAFPQAEIKRTADIIISGITLLFVFPFIYLLSKIGLKKSRLVSFILGMPKVFSGKKSIVGPINKAVQDELYLGKPGLTGLWFTEGVPGTKKDTYKLDVYYARNQNLWFDFEILGKTISKMFLDREKK